jgi:hypothetical protein
MGVYFQQLIMELPKCTKNMKKEVIIGLIFG